jgi:hypothetical protein
MPDSLLSRFQGALYGTAFAQCLLEQSGSNLGETKQRITRESQSPPESLLVDPQTLPREILEVLIQHGQLGMAVFSQQPRFPPENPLESWIATLPLLLFFHENNARRQQSLQELASTLNLPALWLEGATVLGSVLSRIIQDSWNAAKLIPQTIEVLNAINPESQLGHHLTIVQLLLERGASLEETRIAFTKQRFADPKTFTNESSAIALAFYCFLSTPTDFRLSLCRSLRLQDRSPLVTIFTGMISGAYNTVGGIPPQWHMAIDDQIQPLALRLYASWAGIWDAREVAPEWALPTVAAPRK